ncbi:MAG: hypothetical protein AB1554_06145 [Chloroflexota bacterium]
MRICILSDEIFGDIDYSPYLSGHQWEVRNVERPALDFIQALEAREHYDLYLNQCDACADEDRPGVDVIQALEQLNLPFTGSSSDFYEPTREQMEVVAKRQGVGFARGVHVKSLKNLDRKVAGFRYPLIVKHPNSYASVGLTRQSRVEDEAQLREQVQRNLDRYGAARVEEFIEGREFSVLIVDNPDDLSDPYVYPPAETVFPPGESFKHEIIKWEYIPDMQIVGVEDEALASRLQDMVRKMYLGLNGVGYGRADIRMAEDGGLFMLELNSNCALFYPPEEQDIANSIIALDPDGYDGLLDRMFRTAFLRHRRLAEARQLA